MIKKLSSPTFPHGMDTIFYILSNSLESMLFGFGALKAIDLIDQNLILMVRLIFLLK